MLLFGVCINDIEKAGINWKKVSNLLQEYDAVFYKAFCEDIGKNPSDQDAMDWFSNYETEGRRSGIGAFLHDLIEDKENIALDIDDPDGVYLGLSAAVPWEMDDSIKNLTKESFTGIMQKYIHLITDAEIEVRWWRIDDDLDW